MLFGLPSWGQLVDTDPEPQFSQVTHCGRFCLPPRTPTPPLQAIKVGPRPVDLLVRPKDISFNLINFKL